MGGVEQRGWRKWVELNIEGEDESKWNQNDGEEPLELREDKTFWYNPLCISEVVRKKNLNHGYQRSLDIQGVLII